MKIFIFDVIFPHVCSLVPNQQDAGIESDHGLTPNKRQANIWNDDAIVCWRIYVSLSLNEF